MSTEGEPDQLAPVLSDAISQVLGVLRTRGRARLERAARAGRLKLDHTQARRDLDKLYQKLGRETARLIEGGEVKHPGLAARIERIHQQEQRIDELREKAQASGESFDPEPDEDLGEA